MSIQTKKLSLIAWISSLNDQSAINKLVQFKLSYLKGNEWFEELNEIEKTSILKGLSDIEKGKVHANESALKIYEKFL